MSDVVHSCIVHDGDNIEIVFNDTSSYKSSAVNIACSGGTKKKVFADNAIVHFKLPKDCEVSNEHFRIDKLLTAKLETRILKKKSISVATYKLKDIQPDHYIIRNSATHEIIQSLLEESREAEVLEASNTSASLLLEEGQNHMRKMSIFGFSSVSIIIFVLIVCALHYIVKNIRVNTNR